MVRVIRSTRRPADLVHLRLVDRASQRTFLGGREEIERTVGHGCFLENRHQV